MSLTITLSDDAVRWLRFGEKGLSSDAIFEHMTGLPRHGRNCSPLDPDDLRRCVLLLEEVPEFAPRIGEMASVSKEWAGLVAVWPLLTATLAEEMKRPDHLARKTYALMNKARGERAP